MANLLPETPLHAPPEGGPSVLEAKQHGGVVEGAKEGDEGCDQLVGGVHHDLVVLGVHVQKAEGLIAGSGVDHLVNPWKGEWVLGTGLVEASVVDANSPFPILLIDLDRVG